ncbi:hypothetical protein OK351_10065 [Glutamicibacter sp. MNS18]|uniref:hypothetical protein n=1 Tax=Glutamicibacter sp. MNS18 TaxID=2989817 RepID=UPI0022366FCE|nr:hypothetical protein [Glutamicibacter sp. MNS18]MCW4465849.1 hypothetical protein [Glutamicibacter sp. MNS18]
MKLAKLLAIAALAIAPIAAIQTAVPAEAAAATVSGPPVAEPAGISTEFSKWVCKNFGIACG